MFRDEINEKKCNTINEMFEILKLKTINGLPEKYYTLKTISNIVLEVQTI